MISISELEALESKMSKDWTFTPPVAPAGCVDIYSSSCEEAVLEWVNEDGDQNDASGVCAMRNSFKNALEVIRAALELQETKQGFEAYGSDYHRNVVNSREEMLRDILMEFSL